MKKACIGIALASVLAMGCGSEMDVAETPDDVDVGVEEQMLSGNFNGCTYTTTQVQKVSPSQFAGWDADVRAVATIKCANGGNYGMVHNIRVFSTYYNSWANYHIAIDLVDIHLSPDEFKSGVNREHWEPGCYRSNYFIQKFRADGTTLWRSPTITTAPIALGRACP
jgi:hypothetical protein